MGAPILWAPGIFALSAGKPSMSIKFLVLGGGHLGFLEGGGECRFYFYGRGDFSDKWGVAKGSSTQRIF